MGDPGSRGRGAGGGRGEEREEGKAKSEGGEDDRTEETGFVPGKYFKSWPFAWSLKLGYEDDDQD